MLSYRHGFHAGNGADVLKHWLQVYCLDYLRQKDKPFVYIDTHAGAGRYRLDQGFAQQTAEAATGIGRLWRQTAPAPLSPYLQLVEDVQKGRGVTGPDNKMPTYYPGSPEIARRLLRNQDRLHLCELSNAEWPHLNALFAKDKRTRLYQQDGFKALKALLPPNPRRGMVLIDPSYEIKSDYQKLLDAVAQSLKRFATGMYLLWYPLLNRPESQHVSDKLKRTDRQWCDLQLQWSPIPEKHGMYGCGVFIINPPWLLPKAAEEVMPFLSEQLKIEAAHFSIDAQIR